MPLTTSQQISIGSLCALYTSNEIASGARSGGVIDRRLPHLIFAVNQGLKWLYEYDPTNEDLVIIGNYLISICRHQFRAQGVLDLNNGGTVSPITPGGGSAVNDLDFIVSASSYIATGESAVTFDGTNGMPDLRGYNIDFYRNGTTQYTTNPADGSLYYAWNNVTGYFQLLGDSAEAQVGERFRISPDAGVGSSAVPTQVFPFVVTSADFEADGVTLLDSRITGNNIYLLSNNVPNPVLTEPSDFSYVAGGIEIILPGFDANSFSYTIVVNKIN